MARFEELDEQAQQQWLARIARERENLSASVEEAMQQPFVDDDRWEEEVEDAEPMAGKSAMLVPPRLSLQSRPMPTVHPPVHPVHPLHTTRPVPVELSPSAQPGPRLGGRTTKVRLKAVAKSEASQKSVERNLALDEAPTYPRLTVLKSGNDDGRVNTGTFVKFSGSGVFESGQGEVAIINTSISPASVVLVTLIGDPGPVVVQYVTLRPAIGFTIHLSASAKNRTPFNYVIL
jgi:hypothetical protein